MQVARPGSELSKSRLSETKIPVEEWLRVCRFQPFNQFETLNKVLQHVEQAMERFHKRGSDTSIQRPVVVFDLDDTCFRSNQPRTWRILQEWLAERPGLRWDIRQSLRSIRVEQLAYNSRDTFSKVAGLSLKDPVVAAALDDFLAYWDPRFFSHTYCQLDPIQAGAIEYVQKMFRIGANIAYLTGRDEPRMGFGTRRAIAMSGLPPLGDRAQVFLKPNKTMDDAEFKRSVRAKLMAWGNVVATFDNAPANCVVLKDSFPNAMHVFVDTVYDTAAVAVRHGLYKIYDFVRRL